MKSFQAIFYLILVSFSWACRQSPLTQALHHPNEVTKLDLSARNLSVLSDSIALLKNLEELDLSDNQLTSLPQGLFSLKKLKKLSLGWNQLRNLPSEISQLTALEELTLDSNRLDSLPQELSKLVQLKKLHFGWNRVKALPTTFSNLSNISEIRLFNNPIQRPSTIQTLFPTLRPDLFYTREKIDLAKKYFDQAQAFAKAEQPSEAIWGYQKVLALYNESSKSEQFRMVYLSSLWQIATILRVTKEFKKAIPFYDDFLTQVPQDNNGYLDRGVCKAEIHDMTGACEDWKLAERFGNQVAKRNLAFCQ